MRAFIIFVTSILLMSSIIFSCGDDTTGVNGRTDGQDGADFGRDGSVNNSVQVVCRDSDGDCSGSDDCCGQYEDCADKCDDLFSSGIRSECKKYNREMVNKIENIVNNIFDRPSVDKLYDDEDLKEPEPLCALLELSPKTWINKVKDYYSSNYARITLEWLVSKNIWYYFLSAGDESLSKIKDEDKKDYLLDLLEQLIGKLGGAGAKVEVSDTHLLNGLTDQKVADEKTIFYLAEREAKQNNTGFYFVHEEIVVEKLCKEANQPAPNTTKYTGYSVGAAKKFAEEACILAVYCKAGPYTDNQYESDRKRVARLIGTQVKEFIATPIVDGGLGVDEDASEWPNESCLKLRQYWKNGDLNLDLGAN